MRIGIGDGSEHTLEEVGQSFRVTRERIREIEATALRELRRPSRSRKPKAFPEGIRIRPPPPERRASSRAGPSPARRRVAPVGPGGAKTCHIEPSA
jgi:hypothetical protein